MSTFLFVPGAWLGGWCWRDVAGVLEARGHRTICATLTGLGERAHLVSREIGLEMHVADVLGLLHYQDLSDVVLVGHSYGGTVVTAAAEQAPHRLRRLVYLDASVPQDGQTNNDVVGPLIAGELRSRDAPRNVSSVALISRRSFRVTRVSRATRCAGGAFLGGAEFGCFGLWTDSAMPAIVPATVSATPSRKRRRRTLGDDGMTRMQREYQQLKRVLRRRLDGRRLCCFAVCFRCQRGILGALAVGVVCPLGPLQSPDQQFVLDAISTQREGRAARKSTAVKHRH